MKEKKQKSERGRNTYRNKDRKIGKRIQKTGK